MRKLLLVGLLLTLPLHAQVLTPQTVAKLKSVSSVKLAHNGKLGAYTLSLPREIDAEGFTDGPAYTEVYLVDPAGHSRPFLTSRFDVSAVRFTPDDRAITFLSKRHGDEHTSLYRMPVDGGEPQKIASLDADIKAYALSPDGKRIAYTAVAPPDARRKKLKKMGFQPQVFEEDWQNVRLYLNNKPVDLEGSVGEIQWQGNLLAVTLAPNPGVDAELMYRRIHLLDANGKVLRQIANPGKLGQFEFSPDARHLALITAADINDPDNGRLWVADTQTGQMRDLWPNLDGRVGKFVWTGPQKLRALVFRGLNSEVWDVGLDGSHQSVVPAGEVVYTDMAGESLFVGESWKHPGEVFWGGKRLTVSNPSLEKARFAKQEAFSYKAQDGQTIEGVLIHPLEGAGKPAPLILYVHGGPEAMVFNGWLTGYSLPGQIAASRGFAVFHPNYRGSTNRGVAFSKLGQGDAAGREFQDLVDGVDALVARGVADRSKVGITGASYGGYATAWCSTYYSDRFAAGVMSVGISDKISKAGTTDIPQEEFLVHARKRPWDDWNFFLERSPIRHVQKHRTPLLIMHGKDDPRVHPSQSLELYRYLKLVNQAPVRLVLYPGEGHGNRKATNRFDYNLRMLQWMEHYLKGAGGAPPAWDLDYSLP